MLYYLKGRVFATRIGILLSILLWWG